MSILIVNSVIVQKLEKEISSYISLFEDTSLLNPNDLNIVLNKETHPTLHALKKTVLDLILETGFCHLRGIPSELTVPVSGLISHCLGFLKKQIYQDAYVTNFHMSPNPVHDTESLGTSPVHSDFATANTPPRISVIGCIRQDPCYPDNGCTILYDIYECFYRLNDRGVLNSLEEVQFPFANPSLTAKDDVLMSPLITKLSLGKDQRVIVRFQRNVIAHGFKLLGVEPTEQQSNLLSAFYEEVTKKEIRTPLASGEVVFLDNHRMLHTRNIGSVIMTSPGVTEGRKLFLIFILGLRSTLNL